MTAREFHIMIKDNVRRYSWLIKNKTYYNKNKQFI
jgi:hypothetical protein